MVRKKIIEGNKVFFTVPFLWKMTDGEFGYVRMVQNRGGKLMIVEKDGQCYVSIYDIEINEGYAPLFFPIKEKFDDLEGEEVNDAGGNASEKEE